MTMDERQKSVSGTKDEPAIEGVTPLPHHVRDVECLDRPAYRDGRKKTAVKVYAPHLESKHLLIFNVPKLGLMEELR